MSRQPRKFSESGIYHTIIRGNERKAVFSDDSDRYKFLKTISSKKSKIGFNLYAYCLMSNHVHLLVNTVNSEISRIMQSINTEYAHYFNQKYERVGHVFQDRFKSEPVETDTYLLTVVRYIHANPLKAALVAQTDQYQWSSYNSYINEQNVASNIVDCDFVLNLFSEDLQTARGQFIDFNNDYSGDQCLDVDHGKPMAPGQKADMLVQKYLSIRNYQMQLSLIKEDRHLRNEIISELKRHSDLSVRQIADYVGVDRGVVERVKS
jgi:Transposase and inactivated derivatives